MKKVVLGFLIGFIACFIFFPSIVKWFFYQTDGLQRSSTVIDKREINHESYKTFVYTLSNGQTVFAKANSELYELNVNDSIDYQKCKRDDRLYSVTLIYRPANLEIEEEVIPASVPVNVKDEQKVLIEPSILEAKKDTVVVDSTVVN